MVGVTTCPQCEAKIAVHNPDPTRIYFCPTCYAHVVNHLLAKLGRGTPLLRLVQACEKETEDEMPLVQSTAIN